MIKRLTLACLIVMIALGAVAIARRPRSNRSSAPAPADNVIATVNVGSDNSTVSMNDAAIDSVKPDTLAIAATAPKASSLAEGSWINSDPTTIEKLRGRVVLIEFWTFGCYNCRNTLPSVKEWDTKYRDRGLTIVGVHTPETDSEYNLDNVRREVPNLGIKYAVVTDNDYKTWKAYNVEAWPTIFVIDKQGRVRWEHVGEGRYDETETVIKTLLSE